MSLGEWYIESEALDKVSVLTFFSFRFYQFFFIFLHSYCVLYFPSPYIRIYIAYQFSSSSQSNASEGDDDDSSSNSASETDCRNFLESDPRWLLTDNESNMQRLWGTPNEKPYVKDSFHEYVIHGNRTCVHPQRGILACYFF